MPTKAQAKIWLSGSGRDPGLKDRNAQTLLFLPILGAEMAFVCLKNPSLTQAKAALQAGLIQPDCAALIMLVWAEVHLGLEVRP